MAPNPSPNPIDISFVVIGYNEGSHIRACLESVRNVELPGATFEIIYVDGGSQDNSIEEARKVDGVRVLGGDKRRRAAENRNLGASHALGRLIQFIDGDMQLDPEWPAVAMAFLELNPEVAVVSGKLEEASTAYLFRVVQLDWNPREGAVDGCGGAAMYRREVFERAGRFPEDVAYGEEPLLCWRIRNREKRLVWYLDKRMALHDLGFRTPRDYWRQYVRNGRSYIEIASRCYTSEDPLWLKNVVRNFAWVALYAAVLAGFIAGSNTLRLALMALIVAVLARMTIKTLIKGQPLPIALGYAVHCYAAKIPLAWGQLRWLVSRLT